MRRLLLTLVAIALCSRATAIAGEEPAIEWRPWSDSVFASDAFDGPRFSNIVRISSPGKISCVPLHRDQLLASGLFARAVDSKIVFEKAEHALFGRAPRFWSLL